MLCVTMCQGNATDSKQMLCVPKEKSCDQERLDRPLGGGLLLHPALKVESPGELEGHSMHSKHGPQKAFPKPSSGSCTPPFRGKGFEL